MGNASPLTAPSAHPRLYLHCVGSLPSLRFLNIPGFDCYPERALVMAAPGDVVCVPREVDLHYLDFLAALGVGPEPSSVIAVTGVENREPIGPLSNRLLESPALLARIARALGPRRTFELHPYAATPEVFRVAEALELLAGVEVRVLAGGAELTDWADQKHHIRAKALELGVPVADGEVVELASTRVTTRRDREPLLAAVDRQLGRSGRVIVRGASGASGSSTYILGANREDFSTMIASIAARPNNRIFLVEAMVDVLSSPNVQMHIGAETGGAACIGVTDQRWGEGLVHAGNILPSAARTRDTMERWAHVLAGWLRDEGYAGIVGFDFVEYRDGRTGMLRSFLAEVNPRVNGGTYPLALRERLNAVRRQEGRTEVHAFVSGTIETGARSFAQLSEAVGDLFFSHSRGTGLVPYAPGQLAYGKCSLAALAASTQEALDLYAEAEAGMAAVCVEN